MKKLFIFLFSTVLILAEGQWQGYVYPTIKEEGKEKVSQFFLTNTGGTGGGFGRGDPHYALLDVSFWDDKIGWTCGYGGVFRTEDGGLNWKRVKPPGGWYHIRMAGREEVWLLEGEHPGGWGKAKLWHTVDNGATWEEVLPGKVAHYYDLYAKFNQVWVICDSFPSYHSKDGGKSWVENPWGNLLFSAVSIAIPGDVPTKDGFVVYVLGSVREGNKERWKLIKSEDGGRSWREVALPQDLPGPYWWRCQMCFPTSEMGWIGFPEGKIIFTKDGGESWEFRDLPTNQLVTSLWFDQLGRGFASVENKDIYHLKDTLYETKDGGKSWRVVLGGDKTISAICALGPGYVWAVGDVPGFVPNDIVAILRR
jgi:hypothetical protein